MAGESVAESKPLHLPSTVGDLPTRWAWLRLDDACDGVFDCPHSTPTLVDSGPLVVRSQDIITGVFRTEQAARVSEETYKERTSRVVPARGDLLYSREGTYFGIAAEVPERTRVCLGQRMVLIQPKRDVVDFRFLCHWLNSPIMASHIHGYRDGTVAERLNLPTIRALPVLVPPLPEQRAVNQFTVSEGQHTRRPDVVLFVNGLPLAVIELKNPADENVTIWSAYQQLQTYQAQIPSLFATNVPLIVPDGVQARIGALAAGREWFKPWRTITGKEDAAAKLAELQVVLEGVFEKRRFLDLVRHFIVFEDEGGGQLIKKMAGHHQFHAVNVAVQETLRAAQRDWVEDGMGTYFAKRQTGGEKGDRRVGVVWHTQGSGKSLTMAFYAGRVILHPAMENPTLVV